MKPNDLMVFLAVLREGGFRAAAKRMNVAPSMISSTVSRIELQLGVPLLLRTTRSVRATEQGQALAERIRPLFAEIDTACKEAAMSTNRVQGTLKLNVPGAVMPDILPPILTRFQERHPDVVVEIMVDNELIDIVAAGCDAGIRYGMSLEKDMISIPIGPRSQQMALAASLPYLEKYGTPRSPADLTAHAAIRYRLLDGPLLPWLLRDGDKSVQAKPNTKLIVSVNALDTGLSYARDGLGIICTFRNWLETDFRAQTLIPVLPEFWWELEGPRLYYPSRFTSMPLRAFIEICGTSIPS